MAPIKIEKQRRTLRRQNISLFSVVIIFFILAGLLPRMFITIPPGHIGVLWLRFFGGNVHDFYLRNGTRLIFPWDKVYIFDDRLKRLDQKIESLTSDGLRVDIQLSATYFADPQEASEIMDYYGPDYEHTLLEPILASELTLFVASHGVNQMYSLTRAEIVQQVVESLRRKLLAISRARGDDQSALRLLDVDIRSVDLPAAFRTAVEGKLAAEQAIFQAQFGLKQQALENQREILHAKAVKEVENTINSGMSDAFLKWSYIRTLSEVARSPNSKVVVMGGNQIGVPVIGESGDKAGASPPR